MPDRCSEFSLSETNVSEAFQNVGIKFSGFLRFWAWFSTIETLDVTRSKGNQWKSITNYRKSLVFKDFGAVLKLVLRSRLKINIFIHIYKNIFHIYIILYIYIKISIQILKNGWRFIYIIIYKNKLQKIFAPSARNIFIHIYKNIFHIYIYIYIKIIFFGLRPNHIYIKIFLIFIYIYRE